MIEDLVGRRKRTPAYVKTLRRALPQILLVVILSVYMAGSAYIYRRIDENMAKYTFADVILFEFGTLTTIGYGNLYPTSDAGRIFTVVFSILGIPIALLALANFGRHTAKAFWYTLSFVGFANTKSKASKDTPMPLSAVFCLFLVTIIIGSQYVHNTGERNFVDTLYFNFISFTTVGFGDRIPLVNDSAQLAITMIYLAWGILLTTALFTLMNQYFRKVHYIGRRFTGARDVAVWVGGKRLAVSQLISIVGDEFHASPREVRTMLHDLDNLLPKALSNRQDKTVPLASTGHLEDFDCYE